MHGSNQELMKSPSGRFQFLRGTEFVPLRHSPNKFKEGTVGSKCVIRMYFSYYQCIRIAYTLVAQLTLLRLLFLLCKKRSKCLHHFAPDCYLCMSRCKGESLQWTRAKVGNNKTNNTLHRTNLF